jgi:hypothetical protein
LVSINKILDETEEHRARQRKGICDKTDGIRIYQRYTHIDGKQAFVAIGMICLTCRYMMTTPFIHVYPRARLKQALYIRIPRQQRRREQRKQEKTRNREEWIGVKPSNKLVYFNSSDGMKKLTKSLKELNKSTMTVEEIEKMKEDSKKRFQDEFNKSSH